MGGVAIAVCAIMAWYGVAFVRSGATPLFLFCYWGVFLVSLVVAMYMVLLDVRYIRLQYILGKREVFRSTLGEESFRRSLREGQDGDDEA